MAEKEFTYLKSFCPNCEYIGIPIYERRGDGGLELLLWFFFILPGFIYTLWRSSSRYPVCPKCHAQNMIPGNTPKGKELIEAKGQKTTFVIKRKKIRYWLILIVFFVIVALICLYLYVYYLMGP